MQETPINWTEVSWNPASGCTKISEECKHCYAETIAENKRGTPAFPQGFDVYLRPWKLDEPRKLRRPSLVFTNSMTDMFHDAIPDEYRDRVCETMERYSSHRYQVLTKRPENALRYAQRRTLPRSMWLGVTVGHEKRVGRIDVLRQIDVVVRFVSAEPLLTALDGLDLNGIHWVITGGESGTHMARPEVASERGLAHREGKTWVARPDRIPWVRSIRDQCVAAGVAFWHKQWGGVRPEAAGRELDGRTWDEMPIGIAGAMPPDYDHAERNVFGRARASAAPRTQVALPIMR